MLWRRLVPAGTGCLLVACCLLGRLPQGRVELGSDLVYPGSRTAEPAFAHPGAQDFTTGGFASKKGAFHPFQPHSFALPAPKHAKHFTVPHCDQECMKAWTGRAMEGKLKQVQMQQLVAHPKARLTDWLLHKPMHHKFSTLPAGGRHIPAHPKNSLSHHLLTKPLEHSFAPKKRPAAPSGPWWRGKGKEGQDIATAARWGLMHPAGAEKGASMLQHMTEHEHAADHAFWSRLGYKGMGKKMRPRCKLYQDC